MISPKPSDPRDSITPFVFSSIPPKKGTSGPKSIEVKIATATIKARNFVKSHKALVTLFNISNIFTPYGSKKERGTLTAPFPMIAKKRLIYTYPAEPQEQ